MFCFHKKVLIVLLWFSISSLPSLTLALDTAPFDVDVQLEPGITADSATLKMGAGHKNDTGPSGDSVSTLAASQGSWPDTTLGGGAGDSTPGVETVLDTLVVDGFWTVDKIGYNWQHQLPGDSILEQGGRVFRLEYEFLTAAFGRMYVVTEVSTKARFGA